MQNIILAWSLLSFASISQANSQTPFGNQIKGVSNYNRATTQVATGGSLGENGVQELATQGFKTIIDLRTETEGTNIEKQAVEQAGMRYINIPVTAKGIDDVQLSAFINTIEHTTPPILVHCASGNRAGAMWAAYRLHKGIALDVALEEGRTAGMQIGMEEKIKESCSANNLC